MKLTLHKVFLCIGVDPYNLVLFFWNFLIGPKGPGGTSIPNNYCNKCQGSNKKTGKSGSPCSACQCTSEFIHTRVQYTTFYYSKHVFAVDDWEEIDALAV